MYWRVIPEMIIVAVNTDVPPSDEDWDAYIKDAAPHLKNVKGVLVYSESVGPTAPQRARSSAAFKQANPDVRAAIMTGSRVVRGIVTAMSWALGENVKAFSTADFEGAVKYLELDTEEALKTKVLLKQLARAASTEVVAFAEESGRFRQRFK